MDLRIKSGVIDLRRLRGMRPVRRDIKSGKINAKESQKIPKLGSLWKHKSGAILKVLKIENLDTKLPDFNPVSVVCFDRRWEMKKVIEINEFYEKCTPYKP